MVAELKQFNRVTTSHEDSAIKAGKFSRGYPDSSIFIDVSSRSYVSDIIV
jgi:hypothetical protein